jgi:MFS family permease
MSLVNPIGAALGPALGGFLQSSLGFTPLFWTAASLGLLGLICTCQVQEPPLHVDLSKEGSTNHAQFWRLLASPRISSLTVVMLLVGLSFGAMSIFIPLFIAEAEASLNPGLFFTVGAISSLIIRFVTGRASDRYGRGLFITLSLTAYTVAMSMLWFANTVTGFLLAGLFEGAGFGILIPMVSALIADRSEPQERGRLFGLCMAGFDLGIGLSGPLFGSVADAVGYRLMFCLAGVLAFVSLAVFVTLSNQNMRQSVQFALGQGRDFYAVQDIRLKTQS